MTGVRKHFCTGDRNRILFAIADVAIGDRNEQGRMFGMYVQRFFYRKRSEE